MAVTWFGVLQERRGRLTLAQIRQLSRLLADRADLLARVCSHCGHPPEDFTDEETMVG